MTEEFSEPVRLEDGFWLVKCKVDLKKQVFVPLMGPSTSTGSKKVWTESEDQALKGLVLYKGSMKWTTIAEKLNETMHNNLNIRQAKHCRERWNNFLNPTLNWAEWSAEEDKIIISNHKLLGNKWTAISKLLSGRTENQVKNRWRCLQRKVKKISKNEENQVFVEIGGESGSGEGSDEGLMKILRIDEIVPGKYYEDFTEYF